MGKESVGIDSGCQTVKVSCCLRQVQGWRAVLVEQSCFNTQHSSNDQLATDHGTFIGKSIWAHCCTKLSQCLQVVERTPPPLSLSVVMERMEGETWNGRNVGPLQSNNYINMYRDSTTYWSRSLMAAITCTCGYTKSEFKWLRAASTNAGKGVGSAIEMPYISYTLNFNRPE